MIQFSVFLYLCACVSLFLYIYVQVNNRGGISLLGQNSSITLSYVEDYSSAEYVVSAAQFLLSEEEGQPADFFLAPYSR
jgi:hypothetical protein